MTEARFRDALRLLTKYNHPGTRAIDRENMAWELWVRFGVIVEMKPDARTSA